MSVNTLLLLAGVGFVSAFLQGLSGFGYGLIAIPLASFILGDPVLAVVTATGASFLLASGVALFWRKDIHFERARRVIFLGILSMPVGLVLLTTTSSQALEIGIACAVLLCALLVVVDWGVADFRVRSLFGLLSGFSLTVSGLNGPLVLIALRNGYSEKKGIDRVTTQAVIAAQDLFALLLFIFAGLWSVSLLFAVMAIVWSAPLGWILAELLINRLPNNILRWGTAILMIFCAYLLAFPS